MILTAKQLITAAYIVITFNIINSAIISSIVVSIVNASDILHIANYSLALSKPKLIEKAI